MYLLVLKAHRRQWVLSFKQSSHIQCRKTPSKLLNSCVCLWARPASAIHISSGLHRLLFNSPCCHQHCPKPAYTAIHSTLLQYTCIWCNCNTAGSKAFGRETLLRKPKFKRIIMLKLSTASAVPSLLLLEATLCFHKLTNTTTTQHAGKGWSLFGRILEQIKCLITKQKDYTEKFYWTTCKQFPDTLLSCSDTLT